MSGFTESSNNDTSDSAYYKQATDAADRGEFEYAKEICHNAVKQFEHVGEERKASEAYHLLGMIAYRQGDLKDAEQWYRKSLEIDERSGDEQGAAKTYNNMSAVANKREEFKSAEEWLWKSIHIKEKLGNEIGAAHSYHQLGIVANARGDFESGEKWYFKSLDIKAKLNDEIGIARTCFNLIGVAETQGNNDSAKKWRQKALQALGRKGHAFAAINLGLEAEQQCEYGNANILYLKALDIAKEHGDDEGQSLSYLYLGRLACEMGDYEYAKDRYEKSIEMDERLHAMDRAVRSCFSLGNIFLTRINGGRRDFRSARRWFRKALEIDDDAKWWDWLLLYARLWRYKFLDVFSK